MTARRPSIGRHLYPGLVLAQALHGFESYVAGLYDRLTFVVSFTPEYFVLMDAGLVLLLAAMIPSVAHGRTWALRVAWIWSVAAIIIGAAHLIAAAFEWAYVPGMWTAPLLLVFGAALGRSLSG